MDIKQLQFKVCESIKLIATCHTVRTISGKVETKEELVSMVERLWRSPVATERSTGTDWNQET